MNKAKSLRFHPPSDLKRLSHQQQIKESLEQVEIQFWRFFIYCASMMRKTPQRTDEWAWMALQSRQAANWQRYLLFSAGSLLSGVLFGILFAHLF